MATVSIWSCPPCQISGILSLDSRRQITRPKAATHPSSHGLLKRAFNMHYSFHCTVQTKFLPLAPAHALWGCVPAGSEGSVMTAALRVSSSEVQLCLLWSPHVHTCHFEWCPPRPPVHLHFLGCAVCRLKLASLGFLCIFVCDCVWSVWEWTGLGGENRSCLL